MQVDEIKQQITQLGLGEGNPDISKTFTILDNYIKTGEPWSGKVTLNGYQRHMEIILPSKSHIKCQVKLTYDKNV